MTTNKPTALFANKQDLIDAQSKIKELTNEIASLKSSPLGSQLATAQNEIARLKNENQALRTRPLAISPKPTTAPASTYEWQPAPKPVLSREKFAALTPADKSAFVRDGGKIVEK